jgi:phenylalanine-4-hydroxylase
MLRSTLHTITTKSIARAWPSAGLTGPTRLCSTVGYDSVFSTTGKAGPGAAVWIPRKMEDLDLLEQKTMAAGKELLDDPANPHPGFHDEAYRERRNGIVANAYKYRHGEPLPRVEYTELEHKTWTAVWDHLVRLYPTHACEQHNRIMPLLATNAGFGRERIPQLEDVSNFLRTATGFTIRPVAGLLSARDFFAALAFRVFYSTQYVRHHTMPLFSPEPDVCHELLGHASMFADQAFADFSQELGLLSLGASDEDVERLGRLYWYTVEYGLCCEGGGVRAFGAGLLSSFGELEYCMSKAPKLQAWDPFVACEMAFPITSYQPTYFVAESLTDALSKVREFGRTIERPFDVEYDAATKSITTKPRE